MSTKAFYQDFLFADMSITEEDRWKKLEIKVTGLDELVIVDDIELKNQDYKCFFIKSYLWLLSKICQCQVTRRLCHD